MLLFRTLMPIGNRFMEYKYGIYKLLAPSK